MLKLPRERQVRNAEGWAHGERSQGELKISEYDEAHHEELAEADTPDKAKMKCNKPRYIRKGETGHGKQQKVVKACKDGKEKLVKFGDANMRNNSDKPKNKANFRSRHNCDQKKDKMTAGYWSCKDW